MKYYQRPLCWQLRCESTIQAQYQMIVTIAEEDTNCGEPDYGQYQTTVNVLISASDITFVDNGGFFTLTGPIDSEGNFATSGEISIDDNPECARLAPEMLFIEGQLVEGAIVGGTYQSEVYPDLTDEDCEIDCIGPGPEIVISTGTVTGHYI